MRIVRTPPDLSDLERRLAAKAQPDNRFIRWKVGPGWTLSRAVEAHGIAADLPDLEDIANLAGVIGFSLEEVPLPITEYHAVRQIDVASRVDLQAEFLLVFSRDAQRIRRLDGGPLACQ
jgi:hypothetical protein